MNATGPKQRPFVAAACLGLLACNTFGDETGGASVAPGEPFGPTGVGSPPAPTSFPTASPTFIAPHRDPEPPLTGVEAGRVPVIEDRNGNACVDIAEELLGGCAGEKDAIVFSACWGENRSDEVAFEVPARDGSSYSELSLALSSHAGPLRVEALEAEPPDAATSTGPTFVGVRGGSVLRFSIAHDGPWRDRALSLTQIYLVSEAGDILDEGRLLLVSDHRCPIPP